MSKSIALAEVNLLAPIPKARRRVSARIAEKEKNRAIALDFGEAYFDGPREQGYGGYTYDGRWAAVAKRIIQHFDLRPGQRVLDIGCAKGFLVKDLLETCPGLEVFGFDISRYAIENCPREVVGRLSVYDLADPLTYPNESFDAVLCINTLHNLDKPAAASALQEIQRISGGRAFVQVDAYRNDAELQLFLDWMLTAKTYMKPEHWITFFAEVGYTGDCYWTILECDPEWVDHDAHNQGDKT